jgi:hypothetical protein
MSNAGMSNTFSIGAARVAALFQRLEHHEDEVTLTTHSTLTHSRIAAFR